MAPEKYCGLQLILNLKRSVKLCTVKQGRNILSYSWKIQFYINLFQESRESSPEDINELNSKTKLVRGEGGDIGAGDQTSDIQLKSIKSLHDS